MKNSIRTRLIIILSSFIISIVAFYIILNSLAFESFYLIKKRELLVKTYITINDLYKDETKDINLELEKLDVNKSLNIVITKEDTVIYNRAKGEYNRMRMKFIKPDSPLKQPPHLRLNRLPELYMKNQESHVLYNDGKCVIRKAYDKFFESHNIDLMAELDNGYVLFIRTPMESITESVNISNRFILIIGLIAILIGIFIVLFISRSFTNPILKLSGIANEMVNLNFDVKYDVKGKDEINSLGKSINILSERLEKTISELKTANTQLQRDIEIKTRIDEMRRKLLCNISHELKTPISLVQGYAEGLKDNIANNESSKEFYCDVILDESNKMDSIVKKLLTLMQIESGQDSVTIKRFEITSLINSLLTKNFIYFEQNNINIIFDNSKKTFVWGDEILIEDVLENYLSNALNHIDNKKIIEFKIEDKEKTVRISVFNTGSHIPEEDLDKIWESFYKVDKARSREYGGSGIGLAVVSAIMKAMDKSYGVKNVEGGVEFYIELEN